MDKLHRTITEVFGFNTLRDGQKQVMQQLLDGHSSVAIFPTGGGKSLCYQAPAILLPGITLVVSPLLALMKDQIDALLARGINAARLDSSLSQEEYRDVCQRARSGDLKLLYVAPERFNNLRFEQLAKQIDISLLAIDEAHCISQWGHNFRPDYLKLAAHAKAFGAERVLALTATATPEVAADIAQHLHIAPEHIVRTPFFRANLSLKLTPVKTSAERQNALLQALSIRPTGATIIYVTLQQTATDVAKLLIQHNLQARAYHAGLKDTQREEIQEWFMAASARIVVATIAFGMGIDKSNIRYVYHYNPPKSLESYAQEIGRAGRDGGDSICELFYLAADRRVLDNFSYGDTPAKSSIDALVNYVFSHDNDFEVSNQQLATQFDIRTLVLRTLLVYLELQGYIKAGTPIYTESRFKPLYSSQEILAQYSFDQAKFLRALFSCSKKNRTWFSIDTAAVQKKTGADVSRINLALNHLVEHGFITLQATGVKVPYRILQHPQNLNEVADLLWEQVEEREAGDIARMDQVEALVEAYSCQAALLSEHFGEAMPQACGKCSCCTRGATTLFSAEPSNINPQSLALITQIRHAHPELFREPRALARFLVGVSSPAISKAKLSKHKLFGAFADVPFAQIFDELVSI